MGLSERSEEVQNNTKLKDAFPHPTMWRRHLPISITHSHQRLFPHIIQNLIGIQYGGMVVDGIDNHAVPNVPGMQLFCMAQTEDALCLLKRGTDGEADGFRDGFVFLPSRI